MESAMNGGEGTNSYSKNSDYQRMSANTMKVEIEEAIFKNLDVKSLSSVSSTIRLADLGCSTGPNTFIVMHNMLEAIKRKHFSQNPNSQSPDPEFQVFFNDQTSNDFNTLFASLPADRQYFGAGVPGSFHGRLFPESSLHLVYSCYSLHWLSDIPKEMLEMDSPAWNKGKIYYLNAPKDVYNAYRSQFYNDIDRFLNARAKEIVGGGIMVILTLGCPNEVNSQAFASPACIMLDHISSTFMEMANEGLINETLVDSFNMPIYHAAPAEMLSLVERNGCFSSEKIEFVRPVLSDEMRNNAEASDVIKPLRAVFEGILSKHFGIEATNEMFGRLNRKFAEHIELIIPMIKEPGGHLFIVLKRK